MKIDGRLALMGPLVFLFLSVQAALSQESYTPPLPDDATLKVHRSSTIRFESTAEYSMRASQPAPEAVLLKALRSTWPADLPEAKRILWCESRNGLDPDAWDLSRPDGGPMQLNRETWEPYFEEKYGWTWEQVVFDVNIHFQAAREVYDRTGGWARWTCYQTQDG